MLGQVKDCGVVMEQWSILPPKNRSPPSQFQDLEEKVERLTVTCADIGANIEFINFTPILTTQAVGRINSWTTILCWILSIYRAPDLVAMVKAMEMLPAPSPGSTKTGVGSKSNRKHLTNALWLAHYRETGLDRDTGKVPAKDWLEWAQGEVKKQDEHRSKLTGLVKSKKGAKKGTN